jgi:hypothetical protein
MATCALLGQAVGTAAAICKSDKCLPAQVDVKKLQTLLMEDDAWLPGLERRTSALARQANLSGDGQYLERLLDGVDRDLPDADHAWEGKAGDAIIFEWNESKHIGGLRFVFDSNLRDKKKMPCSYPQDGDQIRLPKNLVRDFDIEAQNDEGHWIAVFCVRDNAQRLVRIPMAQQARALRIKMIRTWGAQEARIFACEPVEQIDNVPLQKRPLAYFAGVRETLMRENPEDFRDPAKKD